MSSSASREWITSGSPVVARGRDVGTEALFLGRARGLVVEIVEPGFADGDHFRVSRFSDQVGRRESVPHARDADGFRPNRRRRHSAR